MEAFRRYSFSLGQREVIYYVHSKGRLSQFSSVLVYVHGLSSDITWFKTPPGFPDDAAILYIPRQPNNHTEDFMQWVDVYAACLEDFKRGHHSSHYHLIANCYGTLISLTWVTVKPESFSSVTLINPPIIQKKKWPLKTQLEILCNSILPNRKRTKTPNMRRTFVYPNDYSRIPRVSQFVESATGSTFTFSDSFFFQTFKMQSWLKKNFVNLPVPIHTIYSSEDPVVDQRRISSSWWANVIQNQITTVFSDHYLELLPESDRFWDEVLNFQRDCELQEDSLKEVKTVLVTGATGFLGSHLIRELSRKGLTVIGLARDAEKAKRSLPPNAGHIEFRNGDLNDLQSLSKALKGVDAVIHSAAFVSDWAPYEPFHRVNVEGTKNLLMLAYDQKIKQFIHVSSLGVFGDADQESATEDTQLRLCSDYYSNTKLLAELFVRRYCTQNKIPHTIVRPGFIYGEGDNHFFPKLIDNLKRKKVKYIGGGENYLNTVYVGNVVHLIAKTIGDKKANRQSFNITDPDKVQVKTFFSDVARGLSLPVPHRHVPQKVALIIATVLEKAYRLVKAKKPPFLTRKKITFMVRSRKMDCSKAYGYLGYVPFSYRAGMLRTLTHVMGQTTYDSQNSLHGAPKSQTPGSCPRPREARLKLFKPLSNKNNNS